MKRWLWLLLLAPEAGAACVLHYQPGNSAVISRYYTCDTFAEFPAGTNTGDSGWAVNTATFYVWSGGAWVSTAGAGGGAPSTATYITQTPDAGLSAEQALNALADGVLKHASGVVARAVPSTDYAPATSGSTVLLGNGSGGFSGYAGASCTNQFPRSLSTAGAATCASVASADLALTGTTCTNQFVSAISTTAAGTCTTATLAGAQFANQGTTTTVLHGNAAGNPSFASVDLGNDTSSTLPLAKITDDASSGLCLLSGGGGDPAWTACPGGGGGLSYAQVSASALAGF